MWGEELTVNPRVLLFVAALVVSAAPVRAENWPEFRGPTGQGIVGSGKLPVEWSTTKNVVWKQPVPGKAWSSPIIQEGRVYLTTAVPEETSGKKELTLRTMCLDATSGKPLWEREVFRVDATKAPRIHNKASHANPTPLTD